MSYDYFTFGDFDSRNYNIFIRQVKNGRARQIAPPRTTIVDRAVGSSSEFVFDQFYSPKIIPLNLYSEDENTSVILPKIGAFLGSLGERKLWISYDPYKYYLATFDEQLDAEEYSSGYLFDEINFKLHTPFGFSFLSTADMASGLNYDTNVYYDSGFLYDTDMGAYYFENMTNGQNFDIYHGGNCDFAFPVFKFTGQATTLKIEKFSDELRLNKVGELSYGAFNGTLDIDCNLSNVFKNGVMSNNTFEGDFMSLNGITTPSLSTNGIFQSVNGTQVTLGLGASSTDDFYNGNSIYSVDYNNCLVERREILDYNGSTKVATLNEPLSGNIYDYKIYDNKSGKNYFKITGTGFVNLNLLVDFRFVYI